MEKKLKDFTILELIDCAIGHFSERDTKEPARGEEERTIFKIALDFKIAEQQNKINTKLLWLTVWLVVLTMGLVWLTCVLVGLTSKLR